MIVQASRLTADEAATHLAALDEVRHNLLVGVIAAVRDDPALSLDVWSFGPGACAVQVPGRPIVLGDLEPQQCAAVAEACADRVYPGVSGLELTAEAFVSRARELGHSFDPSTPQRVHALSEAPRYPGAAGEMRPLAEADIALAADWTVAFLREALHDTSSSREDVEPSLRDGRTYLWIADGRPVSMAAITRRSPSAAVISHVYTPPAERGCGYAGSVTAAVVDVIRAQGRATACLYTDLRNPASNRCYARIGFRPICDSLHFARRQPA